MKLYKKVKNFNTTLYVSLLKDDVELLNIKEGDIVEIDIIKINKEDINNDSKSEVDKE